MTPDFWGKPKFDETPFEVHHKYLSLKEKDHKEVREGGENKEQHSRPPRTGG